MAKFSITRTGSYPVSLQEIKDNLKVEHNVEDRLINGKLNAAVKLAEQFLGFLLIDSTVIEYFDAWPSNECLDLRFQSVSGVTVEYYDEDNALQTWGSLNYSVDTAIKPNRVIKGYDLDYPDAIKKPNAVKVSYTVTGDTNEQYKEMVHLIVADLYEKREDTVKIKRSLSQYLGSMGRQWAF